MWGKLGTTRSGETWFPGKTETWEASRPHTRLGAPVPLCAQGCGALAACTGPAAASPSPGSLFVFHALYQPLVAPERSPRAPPSSIVYPRGNWLLYMRLTSPDSAKGAGSFPWARKQLGPAVQFGKGLCRLRARGSVARPLPKGTGNLGLLARCEVAGPSVSALSLPQPERPLPTAPPSPARTPGRAERVLGRTCHLLHLQGERQTEAGEGV